LVGLPPIIFYLGLSLCLELICAGYFQLPKFSLGHSLTFSGFPCLGPAPLPSEPAPSQEHHPLDASYNLVMDEPKLS